MKILIWLPALILMSTAGWADGNDPAIVQEFAQESISLKERVRHQYDEAAQLVQSGADEAQYIALLNEIKSIKMEKAALQEKWRKSFANESSDESYALWDMGETTLSQLVMEYGASDYLYVIPPELSAMKLSLFSSIPLPRESWGEMMEMILSHNGVGVKALNPWVKQLYILKLDPSAIRCIVSREEDLTLAEPHERVFFVFSPKAEQIKSIQGFFERFSDPRQTTVQAIASKIVLVSTRETVEKMLGLYRAVWEQDRGKVVKLVNLMKIAPAEAEKVLKAVFGDPAAKSRAPFYPGGEDLSILTLPQGLVLAGEEEAVLRGERIVMDLEQQLEDPGEKVVYWYSCKHSNPEDIAGVLTQVYDSLIGAQMEKKGESPAPSTPSQEPCLAPAFPCPSTVFNPVMPVNPGFIQPGVIEPGKKSVNGNFVVDAKTSSILMVVRREELLKIKNLLKKLDVPKRMVQIDVMLVEKRLTDRRQVGINLLNINSNLQVPHETGVSFQTDQNKPFKGLVQFLFKRPPGKFPGVDLAYNFLLAQDDLRINANPTVLAINQTPAQISIVDEISINNGAIQLNTGTVTIEKSYTRAQYGTTIVMLPTIHLPDPDENPNHPGFVSLHTDVTFDTPPLALDDRPPVMRRHVVNDVQIADGETVILGGLRRKAEEDHREKIPFLGDLPGIGKLFGADKTTETNTEMFIFITPHIIRDPVDDLRRLRQEEYQLRAGDIPEFLTRLDEAKEKERKGIFANSLKMLFDRI
ncbi:MAG: gspD [Parachlamydiales bacterium]|nr:gspD [Parachlamydiales bacterium]